jgi:hypothetical protein
MTPNSEEPKENEEGLKIAIVALLVAMNFGILHYFGGQQFETMTLVVVLSVISKVFVKLNLLIFLLYVISLGLSRIKKLNFLEKAHKELYAAGMFLMTLIVFATLGIWASIKVLIYLGNIWFYTCIILLFILVSALSIKLFGSLIEKAFPQGFHKIKLSKEDKRHYVTLTVGIASIIVAFLLSAHSTNLTILQSSPVILSAESILYEDSGRWTINITNTHPIRETGTVYLYRLEKNTDKPHMSLDPGLKAGESRLFNLSVEVMEQEVPFDKTKIKFQEGESALHIQGYGFHMSYAEMYYTTEKLSLGVKITCDTCPSQGIIQRLPDFGKIPSSFSLSSKGVSNISIPRYEWTEILIEDIIKREDNS